MNSKNVVLQPSDYEDAIQQKLESLLVFKSDEAGAEFVPFFIEAYAEFGKTAIEKPSVFIDVTKAKGSFTHADGRTYENLEVSLHIVFPNAFPFASKLANNASFDVRDLIVVDNGPKEGRVPNWCWGLANGVVERPVNIDRMPSMFLDGDDGYDSWCVSFVQKVVYGPLAKDEPVRTSIFFALNDDINDKDKYQELKP